MIGMQTLFKPSSTKRLLRRLYYLSLDEYENQTQPKCFERKIGKTRRRLISLLWSFKCETDFGHCFLESAYALPCLFLLRIGLAKTDCSRKEWWGFTLNFNFRQIIFRRWHIFSTKSLRVDRVNVSWHFTQLPIQMFHESLWFISTTPLICPVDEKSPNWFDLQFSTTGLDLV